MFFVCLIFLNGMANEGYCGFFHCKIVIFKKISLEWILCQMNVKTLRFWGLESVIVQFVDYEAKFSPLFGPHNPLPRSSTILRRNFSFSIFVCWRHHTNSPPPSPFLINNSETRNKILRGNLSSFFVWNSQHWSTWLCGSWDNRDLSSHGIWALSDD